MNFSCFLFTPARLWLIKGIVLQAEAKYYCVDELVLGTEQSLGKLGVEVDFY